MEKEYFLGMYTKHGFIPGKGAKMEVTKGKEKEKQDARCPFLHCVCREDCALKDGDKCAIATGGSVTIGGKCPFSGVNSGRRCVPNCPLLVGNRCGICTERKENKNEQI